MGVKSLDDLLSEGVRGQRVFVRADLNVPLRDQAVTDDSRLRASLPTLRRLLAAGARLIVASHLGRPKGQRVAALQPRPAAAPVTAARLPAAPSISTSTFMTLVRSSLLEVVLIECV